MAERPVFTPSKSYPFYKETFVTFKYYAGFALVQRQKNIQGIHEAFYKMDPKARLLEASSKSPSSFGKSLSPFYLMGMYEGKEYPVECIFQASKVFQKGGPFLQLLDMEGIKAKTTSLIKTHGPILYYEYENERYPLEPKGWLYDWIYLKALMDQPEKCRELEQYNGFTDIAFNPKTGSTCQAKVLAMYLGMKEKGVLDEAMSSMDSFLKIAFHNKTLAA